MSDSQFAILAVVAIVALFVGKDVSVVTRFGRLVVEAPGIRRKSPPKTESQPKTKRTTRRRKPRLEKDDPPGKEPQEE